MAKVVLLFNQLSSTHAQPQPTPLPHAPPFGVTGRQGFITFAHEQQTKGCLGKGGSRRRLLAFLCALLAVAFRPSRHFGVVLARLGESTMARRLPAHHPRAPLQPQPHHHHGSLAALDRLAAKPPMAHPPYLICQQWFAAADVARTFGAFK